MQREGKLQDICAWKVGHFNEPTVILRDRCFYQWFKKILSANPAGEKAPEDAISNFNCGLFIKPWPVQSPVAYEATSVGKIVEDTAVQEQSHQFQTLSQAQHLCATIGQLPGPTVCWLAHRPHPSPQFVARGNPVWFSHGKLCGTKGPL